MFSYLFPSALHEGSQHSHSLVHVGLKIEAVLLCDPQLAVIVVEGLLGHAQHARRLGQTHLLSIFGAAGPGLVHRPPFSHQIYDLSYCPFFAAVLARAALSMRLWLVGVSEQDGGGLKEGDVHFLGVGFEESKIKI